jgi:hypothetical protein
LKLDARTAHPRCPQTTGTAAQNIAALVRADIVLVRVHVQAEKRPENPALANTFSQGQEDRSAILESLPNHQQVTNDEALRHAGRPGLTAMELFALLANHLIPRSHHTPPWPP